jgi:cephalosporin-C deacetylase-like acetyl esterase
MTDNGLPSDVECAAYWDDIDTELSALPARPMVECIPGRCTNDFTGYEVRLTSLGAYRTFGYLSVPAGEGPFPALLRTPGYGSVNNPPQYIDRLRYVALTIMHRGQRLADSPYAACYPGLLTDGIADEKTYVYRGIVADCLRAAEFMAGQPDVDRSRIGVIGDDLAVLTAARRPVFAAVRVSGALLYRLMDECGPDSDYPVEELADYLRGHPGHEHAIARTLAFFDAGRHAEAVRGTAGVSVRIDVPDEGSTPGRMAALATALGPATTRYLPTHEGQFDDNAADRWLAERLGVPAMSKFDRTQQ